MTIGGQNFYYAPDAGTTYNQITNTNPSIFQVGNYVVVTGLSGGSQTITAMGAQLNASGKEYGSFASFEIVASAPGNVLPVTTPLTISGGGTLDMTNGQQAIAALSSTDGLGSQVLLGSGALTIAGTAATTFDGTISGSGGLLSLGGGTLTLSGTNTYTGGTRVSGGELIVRNVEALADGSSLTVGNASLLALLPAPVVSSPTAAAATVPEPDALAILATAIVAAGAWRWRPRRRAKSAQHLAHSTQ
jgi:autotransporter-associated beta strand protein